MSDGFCVIWRERGGDFRVCENLKMKKFAAMRSLKESRQIL
jgi:hypothetical protein